MLVVDEGPPNVVDEPLLMGCGPSHLHPLADGLLRKCDVVGLHEGKLNAKHQG